MGTHTHTHIHTRDNKSKDLSLDACQFPAKRSLYNSYKHQKVPTFTKHSPAYGIRDTYVRLRWGGIARFLLEVCCSVLQYVAVCCNVLQCVAVCCSVLQCVAVCCSVREA